MESSDPSESNKGQSPWPVTFLPVKTGSYHTQKWRHLLISLSKSGASETQDPTPRVPANLLTSTNTHAYMCIYLSVICFNLPFRTTHTSFLPEQ